MRLAESCRSKPKRAKSPARTEAMPDMGAGDGGAPMKQGRRRSNEGDARLRSRGRV